jgi:5,10-methylenetetrahydromethanopterin reductase
LTIRLGPSCLNPFTLQPSEIVGQIAALDALSRGRAFLGLARGAWLDAVGITQPRPLTAVREVITIFRQMLAGDQSGLAGSVFTVAPGQRVK